MRTAVFSIISPNYRHYARVLMESLQRHEPHWERFVLLVGSAGEQPMESSFATVDLSEIPLPNREQFTFRYTILELNTAVKPWMFEYLFARGYDRVIYLDPDIVVYAPLTAIEEGSEEAFVILTPHLTEPTSAVGQASEATMLRSGIYNLGFIAVNRRPQLHRFVDWWKERLEFQCVAEPERGLFVDQKWIDLVPGLFAGVVILRDEGYNVAYWNVRQRTLSIEGGAVSAGGKKLRFFHFSGFEPASPDVPSRHDILLKRNDLGAAYKLFEDYAAALRAAGSDSFRNAPYAFARFADGTRLSDAARIRYRNSLELQSAAGVDPFQHSELFAGIRDTHHRSRMLSTAARTLYRSLSRVRPMAGLLPRGARKRIREFLLGEKDPAPVATRDAEAEQESFRPL